MEAIEKIIDEFVTKIIEICDLPMDSDNTEHIAKQAQEKLDMVFENCPRKKYSGIYWTVDDVLEEAESLGIFITKGQAEKILEEGADQILDAMLQAGWYVIRELLLNEYYKKGRSERCN